MRQTYLIALILIIASLSSLATYMYAGRIQIHSTGNWGFDRWRESRVAIYTDDFGQLKTYREQNARYREGNQSSNVVFFGDSIIQFWKLEDSFPRSNYLNRGIMGQTTSQMLVRFHQDVVALKPKVLVMLASNNDLAGITGVMKLEDIQSNYTAIAEIARQNNIPVLFISMLPVHNYTKESLGYFAQRPMEKIRTINTWLRQYAASNGHGYVDVFSQLLDNNGLMRKEYAEDGLHPNAEAYKIMSPLVKAAIEKTLALSAATTPTPTEARPDVAD